MTNFIIRGGIVSFTLQDQARKIQGGQPTLAEPEDIVNVVMREQDFAQLLQFFNQHLAAYEQQSGKRAGDGAKTGAGPAPAAAKPAAPLAQPGGGFKIRPKGT